MLDTLLVNDCFSVPCQHDGICVPLNYGFQCVCPPGYQAEWSSPIGPDTSDTVLSLVQIPRILSSHWRQGLGHYNTCLSVYCYAMRKVHGQNL